MTWQDAIQTSAKDNREVELAWSSDAEQELGLQAYDVDRLTRRRLRFAGRVNDMYPWTVVLVP
jgi:hypothetical protein